MDPGSVAGVTFIDCGFYQMVFRLCGTAVDCALALRGDDPGQIACRAVDARFASVARSRGLRRRVLLPGV
jgi:hypothetical protein